ncbi:sensor histidine kinase [Cohnella sp. WQ 127256]|uniref:sensor histidine kinase n=1 Tax=Cohnella sp. WQ 127256 TaxID=2938790 RepID=UPI0021176735|nr:sensor histidine kinase [Cohnella sp. WQ 127256]
MLSYSAFIIIPVLLVGYIANSVFVESIRQQTRSNIQGTLQQMKDNIAYKFGEIIRISDLLYTDDTLARHLRHYEEGWVNYEATKKYMLPKFRTAIETTRSKVWLSFYLHNDTLSEIYNLNTNVDPLTVNSRSFDWYHIKRIIGKHWYKEFPVEQYKETMQWKRIEDDNQFGRISLLRRLVDINEVIPSEIGFLRISVYLSEMFESVDFKKISEGTAILISDEQQRIVVSSGSPEWTIGKVWSDTKMKDHLVIQEVLPDLNWNLIALVPTNLIERDTTKVRNLTILICLACFFIFSIAGFFISRFFSKRVTKIVSVLDSFQEGEFHKRILFKGNDEFTRISLALNEMGYNIGGLIREVYVTNLQKKEAELASLQAQINPHFLYNTLSSISRLAKFGEVEKLHLMVLDLAKFYRLSLNNGRSLISIFNELEQVKAYIDIQQTKYDERMQVHYDIDMDIFSYETLKLVLQPFVENTLEHAWCGDSINIRIVGKIENGSIVFLVIDDGIGFHPDKIKQIFDSSDKVVQVGYGIRNVDQRIKLHYGREYGVTIVSQRGFGTTVRITFPAIRANRESK